MKKRVMFVLILCLVLVCTVTACAKEDDNNTDNPADIVPEVEMCTVRFDTNGGSEIASIQVAKGERITAPTQPTKKQYVFNGWYKDALFASVWDFDSDTVNNNITLYAKWKQEEVRINSVSNASIVETEITMIVDDEDVNEVDMNDKVVLNDSKATWKLYYDKLGQMEIPTKLATTKEGTLKDGSNIFYIVVTNENGTQTKNYTLDIYKKYEVMVKVYGVNELIALDTIMATTLDTMPTPDVTLEGYTITGWTSTDAKPGEKISKNASLVISLTAVCKPNTYNVAFSTDGGSIKGTTQTVTFASSETLPVPTKKGYSFTGWYYGSDRISDRNGNCVWSIANDVTLTAKYRANRYSVTAMTNDGNAGTVTASGNADGVQLTFDVNGREGVTAPDYQNITALYGITEPQALTSDGYLFKGWFDSSSCNNRFDFTENLVRDTTVYAGWYKLPGNKSDGYYTMYQNGSEVSVETDEEVRYIYFMPTTSGEYSFYYKNSLNSSSNTARIKIYNSTNSRYIKDETAVSSTSYEKFTFNANAGSIYYVCVDRYSASSTLTCYLTTEKPEEYGKFDNPDYIATSEYNQRATVTARTNAGYTFIGWYNGNTKLTGELSYTFSVPANNVTYTAKWIKNPVTLEVNISEAGTVSKEDKTIAGKNTTITAKTNAGYTFIGWYDGNTKLTDKLSYTFTMPANSKTYTAKWCKVSTATNIAEAGSVSSLNSKYMAGEEVTITATTNIGYVFTGWYDGNTKLSDELSYTFTMPAENKTYMAKFAECTEHEPDDDCICTKCGKVVHNLNDDCICTKCGKEHPNAYNGGYCRHDNIIYFGTYPQSVVTDTSVTDALTALSGELPTEDDSKGWTSYGYYIRGSVSNFMWYIDVENAGEKYRGVYFTSYRPYYTSWSPTSDSIQYDNGYYTNTVYWFKYEPIRWQILEESNGKALLLADMAIDSQEYTNTVKGTYYVDSAIRTWINETFYNTAFNDLQKELIQTVYRNSKREKVFLLSHMEATEYITSYLRKNTDYSKSQGGSGYYSSWWLGSRYVSSSGSEGAYYVFQGRGVSYEYNTNSTGFGVVPALWIAL